MGNDSDDDKEKIVIEEIQQNSDKGTIEIVEHEGSALADIPALGTQERALAEKKLVRKLDSRLLPTIFVIYIMNYIDVSFFPPLHYFLTLSES
jgi:hypothetical protein